MDKAYTKMALARGQEGFFKNETRSNKAVWQGHWLGTLDRNGKKGSTGSFE